MVEEKFAAVSDDAKIEADVEATAARTELDSQIAELRAEIARLTDSMSAIGSSAKAVARSELDVMVESARARVREEPVTTLLAVAGFSFVLGLLARR